MSIIEDAKEKIYSSPIIKYADKNKIEAALKKIHIYSDREEFLRVYGNGMLRDGRLEGFNRSGGIYIGPDATTHTVIHEILHEISSEFDESGHRIKNGIAGDMGENFANQVNEGLTDYLAAKISGENPRHYLQGHKIFSIIEPLMEEYYADEEILYSIYCRNNDLELKKFLDIGLKKSGGGKFFYENFLFLNESSLQQEMSKNIRRQIKKENSLFRKIMARFKRNSKSQGVLLLNEGNDSQIQRDKSKQFRKQYEITTSSTSLEQQDGKNIETEIEKTSSSLKKVKDGEIQM